MVPRYSDVVGILWRSSIKDVLTQANDKSSQLTDFVDVSKLNFVIGSLSAAILFTPVVCLYIHCHVPLPPPDLITVGIQINVR